MFWCSAYYVAFGPHGPREPILQPGSTGKTIGGVALAVAIAGTIFVGVRSLGQYTRPCHPLEFGLTVVPCPSRSLGLHQLNHKPSTGHLLDLINHHHIT